MAAPRMLIGVGESIMTPTSMSLLSDRFPAHRLGFASGFYYMGVPIGVGVSLLIVGYLGPAIGWRQCFYWLGGIGVALSLVMFLLKETPRRDRAAAEQAESQTFRAAFGTLQRALRASPALSMTIAGGVVFHFVLGAATFDQLWFVQERGFERAEIARLTGWVGMCAGVLGNLFGGVGGDAFLRRTGLGRAMFLFWILLLLAPFNLAYRLVEPDSIWFWVGVFVGFFQLGCFYGPTFSTVQELVPSRIRATVVAFYILVLNFVGLGVGVSLGGVVIDALIAQGVDEPYTWTLFGFTALFLIAVLLFYFAGRRYQHDRERLFATVAGDQP